MATWKMDVSHSDVKFKVRHLVISTVTGHFTNFSATVETAKDDFTDAKINFEADAASIDTRDERRDGHLKSPDFFDVATYPKLTFVSKSLTKKSGDKYELTGNLTIRDVTKEVKLDVVYNGSIKGFGGVDTAGFEITGTINRHEFGLKFSMTTEAGGVVLGDDVKIEIDAEFNKQQAATASADSKETAAAN